MTDLVVRRLLIDLSEAFPRRWFAGDAFQTGLFNALSMSFPVGEQFFIDSVRNGFKALPPEQQPRFQDEVQGFVGQEATHRRIHGLFNEQLDRQGFVNAWGPRAARRVARLQGTDPRHALAITAANEHFTAIFAEWMLAQHARLAGVQPRLAAMWLWHSAEESEHKSTAFDLYLALGGNHAWRVRWMLAVTFFFTFDLMRQTVNNLWRDGALFRWSTWRGAASFFFGRSGLARQCFGPWRAYFARHFHPSQQHSTRAAQWLAAHGDLYTVVSQR